MCKAAQMPRLEVPHLPEVHNHAPPFVRAGENARGQAEESQSSSNGVSSGQSLPRLPWRLAARFQDPATQGARHHSISTIGKITCQFCQIARWNLPGARCSLKRATQRIGSIDQFPHPFDLFGALLLLHQI